MMEYISYGGALALISMSTFLLTNVMRSLSLRHRILDIPNARSSHQIPTPRGGGVAIVTVFLLSLSTLVLMHKTPWDLSVALLGGGFMIALLGYLDDLYQIKNSYRLSLHFAASLWALYFIGGFPIIDVGIAHIVNPKVGFFLGLLGIVWSINFYNFMDGIDGLAGMQGLFMAISASVLLSYLGVSAISLVFALVAATLLGFTILNFPPAKIFLGDVGSGFLGFVFAVLSIYCAKQLLLPLNFWLILSGVFLWDATFTLFYRIGKGDRWYQAHREHAYQALILRGLSHQQVTLGILGFNVLVLLPLSVAALFKPAHSFYFMLFSTSLIFILWVLIKKGVFFTRRAHETNPSIS